MNSRVKRCRIVHDVCLSPESGDTSCEHGILPRPSNIIARRRGSTTALHMPISAWLYCTNAWIYLTRHRRLSYCLNYNPHYLKALFNVARLYHTQGDHAQATRYFEMVLELDPDYAQADNNLGLIHEEMGEWSEAVMTFQKAGELGMFLPEAHFNLVRALYYQYRGDLGPELLQPLTERLRMIMCFPPDDATGRLIHQRIATFLDFLAEIPI